MRKDNKMTPREQRQIYILRKYHEVDEVNKIVKVKLHYEKASEIISNNLSSKDKPIFDEEIVYKIHSLLHRCPFNYKLDLDLSIDDYEGYDAQILMSSLCDTLELEQYRTHRAVKKSWFMALFLLFIGVFCLLIQSVLKNTGVVNVENLADMVLDYVLDTTACVFIWESVSQLFLYPPEFVTTNKEVFKGFNSLSFYDNNWNLLCQINKEEMISKWVIDNKKERVGKIFLITTGGLHCILAVVCVVNFLVEINRLDFSNVEIISYITVMSAVAAVQLLYGIGSISRFNGKGPLKNFVFVLSIILLAGYGAILAVIILNGIAGNRLPAALIVSFAAGLIATTLNLFGCIWTKENKH